jgi:hypothetical protein
MESLKADEPDIFQAGFNADGLLQKWLIMAESYGTLKLINHE